MRNIVSVSCCIFLALTLTAQQPTLVFKVMQGEQKPAGIIKPLEGRYIIGFPSSGYLPITGTGAVPVINEKTISFGADHKRNGLYPLFPLPKRKKPYLFSSIFNLAFFSFNSAGEVAAPSEKLKSDA